MIETDSTLRRNYQDDSRTLTPGAGNFMPSETPMPPPRPPIPPQRLIGLYFYCHGPTITETHRSCGLGSKIFHNVI